MGLRRMWDLVLRLMGDWNEVLSILEEDGKYVNIKWYITQTYFVKEEYTIVRLLEHYDG